MSKMLLILGLSLFSAACVFSLPGCGQTGPLHLPAKAKEPPQSTPEKTPEDGNSSTKSSYVGLESLNT